MDDLLPLRRVPPPPRGHRLTPDEAMGRALLIARQGTGAVSPNPLVGCVLTDEAGHWLAEGYHARLGGYHAERAALATGPHGAGDGLDDPTWARGATAYVTLEPCAHQGRQPPCADLLVAAGVARVWAALRDPFAQVDGQGIARLRAAGIEVKMGLLAQKAAQLTRHFLTHTLEGRPYVFLKWAETADGYIARADGSSKWISSNASRERVHEYRAALDAILIGYGTAVQDRPNLNVRLPPEGLAGETAAHGGDPIRLLYAPGMTLPAAGGPRVDELLPPLGPGGASAIKGHPPARTILLAADHRGPLPEHYALQETPAHEPLAETLAKLWAIERIGSILVEGGVRTLQRFIDARLWDEAVMFVGPGRFGSGLAAPMLDVSPSQQWAIGPDMQRHYLAEGLEGRMARVVGVSIGSRV